VKDRRRAAGLTDGQVGQGIVDGGQITQKRIEFDAQLGQSGLVGRVVVVLAGKKRLAIGTGCSVRDNRSSRFGLSKVSAEFTEGHQLDVYLIF
jgi:hypothetical protein